VVDGQSVRVDIAGSERVVNVGMLDVPPAPGDWLVVHAGFALGALAAEDAELALALLQPGVGDQL